SLGWRDWPKQIRAGAASLVPRGIRPAAGTRRDRRRLASGAYGSWGSHTMRMRSMGKADTGARRALVVTRGLGAREGLRPALRLIVPRPAALWPRSHHVPRTRPRRGSD